MNNRHLDGESDAVSEAETGRYAETMAAAERSGLMEGKDGRIAGRVSAALIARAKRQTGLASDTKLLEFALANLALEDRFAETFRQARGKIDPDVPLGF